MTVAGGRPLTSCERSGAMLKGQGQAVCFPAAGVEGTFVPFSLSGNLP